MTGIASFLMAILPIAPLWTIFLHPCHSIQVNTSNLLATNKDINQADVPLHPLVARPNIPCKAMTILVQDVIFKWALSQGACPTILIHQMQWTLTIRIKVEAISPTKAATVLLRLQEATIFLGRPKASSWGPHPVICPILHMEVG